MSCDPTAPPLSGVLETVVYFTDQRRAESFYAGTLGLRLLDREEGRSLFFRAGQSVFLLFRATESLKPGKLPPHGARGPVHTCFRVPQASYAAWKRHLQACGVPILGEMRWQRGLSFYFHDSEGNLLEIADRDIWPD